MIVKVCGMRDAQNIRDVVEAGADWIGLIFWSESKRFVSQIRGRGGLLPDYSSFGKAESGGDESGEVAANRPKPVKRVGVFVDDMPQTILTRVVNYKLDVVQLHGDESPVMIDNLRCTLDPDIRPGIEIMKTISIGEASDFAKCEPYIGHVDYFLFDTKCDGKGGSGRQFDWQMLSNYQFDVPFILSGGIGPDDAVRIKALNHPQLLGVDVNSRFETEPAMKDAALVKRFITELK